MDQKPGRREASEMNEDRTAADAIEFEIKRLPRGGFKTTVHMFRGGRWWPPDGKPFVSELEAMRWINSRMALHGFEEAYPTHLQATVKPY
jgi:hypothetical protein